MLEETLSSLMKTPKKDDVIHFTSVAEIRLLHVILNDVIFNNELTMPEIEVCNYCRKYWGYFAGDTVDDDWSKTTGKIKVYNKWINLQFLITILAHEMVHQYQWMVDGPKRLLNKKNPIISHGPSFFAFRDRLKQFGIPLNRKYSNRLYSVNPKFIRKRREDKYNKELKRKHESSRINPKFIRSNNSTNIKTGSG